MLGLVMTVFVSLGSCNAAADTFTREHASVWKYAGSPPIVCVANDGDGVQAQWAFGSIYVEDQPADANYSVWMAHELGHAWADAHDFVPTTAYGDLRGFPRPTGTGLAIVEYGQTLREDYADVFAYALGEWRPMVGVVQPPPYAFQNAAGVPTPEQITALREMHLLPGVWEVPSVPGF